MTATTPTPVLFRRHIGGDIFALFPTLPATTTGESVVYDPASGHGAGHAWTVIACSRPVTDPTAYRDLLLYLSDTLGYGPLRVVRRVTDAMMDARRTAAATARSRQP